MKNFTLRLIVGLRNIVALATFLFLIGAVLGAPAALAADHQNLNWLWLYIPHAIAILWAAGDLSS